MILITITHFVIFKCVSVERIPLFTKWLTLQQYFVDMNVHYLQIQFNQLQLQQLLMMNQNMFLNLFNLQFLLQSIQTFVSDKISLENGQIFHNGPKTAFQQQDKMLLYIVTGQWNLMLTLLQQLISLLTEI